MDVSRMLSGKGLAKKALAAIALAAVALGAYLAVPQQARAASWLNCEPYLSLSTYKANGCAYNTSAPYSQSAGNFANINVYVDPNSIPSWIANDVNVAIENWNDSGAHVRLALTNTTNVSNLLAIYGSSQGYNFQTSCSTSGAWGQSWGGGSNLYHTVWLDNMIFGCGYSTAVWAGLIAHEMGHTMGLGHNDYYNGAVHMRMYTNPAKLRDGSPMTKPQFTDYFIFNKIYTSYPTLCNATSAAQSNYWCNGMDPYEQSCGGRSLQHTATPYGWVEIWWSDSCKSNWAKGASTVGGWTIYRIQTNRNSGTNGGAITIEDIPNTSTWYTNIVFSPNNTSYACISYLNTSTGATTGFYCTSAF
jgi:hypothetical protein